jgi:hypothetical protein
MSTTQVRAHPLPATLVTELEQGSWAERAISPAIADVFGEQPSPSAAFYSLDEMRGETARWVDETDAAYLGSRGETLDPKASVIIGDLGYDRPFALDYRVDPPQVRLLALDGRWAVVTASIDELLGKLGDPPH